MSPDPADQSGTPDASGVHPSSGNESGDPGARHEDGGVEASSLRDSHGAEEAVASSQESPSGVPESQPEAGSGDVGGIKGNGADAEMGAGGPGTQGGLSQTLPEGGGTGSPSRNDDSKEDQKEAGGQIPRTSGTRSRVAPRDVAVALKLTDPNWPIRKRIDVAAASMRVSDSTIRSVIDRDPELRAAYGTTGKALKARMPQALAQTEVVDRDEDDIPAHVMPEEKAGVELLQLVDQAERDLHMKSLEAIGVNEGTLTKLRKLDGMASSTGAFIAIGLEKTHRLYYLAVVDLKTVADQIKERYLDDPGAVTDEQRPFYYRNYIDAVKEFGRAYDLFLQGAAIILKIVGQNSGIEPSTGKTKAKLGFSGRSLKHANRDA